MPTLTIDRMRSIQRASRALLIFFIFMSLISLWATVSSAWRALPEDGRTLSGVMFRGAAITGKIHGLWLFQTALGAALALKVLFHLVRLMILFSRGQLFTAQSVAQTRQAGVTCALALAGWVLVLTAIAPELSTMRDQWQQIMPSFPGDSLMGACFFLFAGRILDEAREMREEQDLVV